MAIDEIGSLNTQQQLSVQTLSRAVSSRDSDADAKKGIDSDRDRDDVKVTLSAQVPFNAEKVNPASTLQPSAVASSSVDKYI